jgi:sensor histidine kinase YesM
MSAFISIAMGIMVYAIVMLVQLSFLKKFPPVLIGFDIFMVVIVSIIIFLTCLLHIQFRLREGKLKKRSFLPVALLSALFFFAGALVLRQFGIVVLHYPNIPFNIFWQQTHNIIGILIFFGGLLFVNFFISLSLFHVTDREERKELEYENALLKMKNIETSYLQLRQQVNPHFLFNALNTLKTLIKKYPDKAETYLVKLSNFLRKSIATDIEPVITVNEELSFCCDYIELQKMRFGDALHFSVDIPESAKTGFVPVFSIQQLVENSIKHNSLTVDSPLNICLNYNNQWITVSNNLQKKTIAEKSAGTGLINLSERYRLLSGDEVITDTSGNRFSVSIKVLNEEDCNH